MDLNKLTPLIETSTHTYLLRGQYLLTVKNLIKEIGKNTIKYENLDQEDKKLLSRLNFLPSYNNLVKEETYIRPDLVVKKQNENFVVVLNDKFLNETLYQKALID